MNEDRPMTNGEKHNDLPLARRPSGAIQKVAPGANRILSGMAADALALVPVRQPDKAVCIVLTGDDMDGTIPLFLFKVLSETEGFERFNFRHVCFKRASDLPTIAETEPFDLIVINFTRVMWDIGNEENLGSRLRKNNADAFDDVLRFLAALKSKHHNKPIIIFSTLEDTRLSASRFAEVGVNYFLMPDSVAECKAVFPALSTSLNANLHTMGMWSKASLHVRRFELIRHVRDRLKEAQQQAALDRVIDILRQRPACRQRHRRIQLGRHDADDVATVMRFCNSSGDTSSTCVATFQAWPNGSVNIPDRSP